MKRWILSASFHASVRNTEAGQARTREQELGVGEDGCWRGGSGRLFRPASHWLVSPRAPADPSADSPAAAKSRRSSHALTRRRPSTEEALAVLRSHERTRREKGHEYEARPSRKWLCAEIKILQILPKPM